MVFMNKKMSEMTNQERCLLRAYGIMRERAEDAKYNKDFVRATAYESASDMLRYAVNENWECLRQYI